MEYNQSVPVLGPGNAPKDETRFENAPITDKNQDRIQNGQIIPDFNPVKQPAPPEETAPEQPIVPRRVQTVPVKPDSIQLGDSHPEPEPKIQISEPNPTPALSETNAADRALRSRLGFPNGPDYTSTFDSIVTGQESPLRQSLAGIRDREIAIENQNIIMQMAKNRGKPFTLPESLLVQDMLNQKRANPDTVIEDGYAEAFIKNLRERAAANPDTALARSFNTIPGFTERDLAKGQDYKGRKEMWYSLLQEAEAAYGDESKAGAIVDFLKFGIPGYQFFKQQGLNPTTPWSLKTGENLDAQARDWYIMPREEFNTKAPLVARKLMKDNPELAISYISAMINQSHENRIVNNLLPLQDAMIAADLARAGIEVGSHLYMARQVRIAIQDYLKAKDIPTGEVPLANAAGDTVEAGIKQTVKEVSSALEGDLGNPADATLRPMQSAFRDNVNQIVNDPSTYTRSLGQEFVNRLAERNAKAYSDFLDRVTNTMKVERIPAALAIEKNVRAMVAETIKQFPGLENTIMDVRFRKDGAGNLLADSYISRDGVQTFPTSNHAKDFALEHKLGDVNVQEVYGPPKPKEIPPTNSFKTAQGSEYIIHSDGTTTRTPTGVRPGDTVKRTATRNFQEWRPFTDSVPIGSEVRTDVSNPSVTKKEFLYKESSKVEVLPEAPNKGPDGRMYQKVKTPRGEEYVPVTELTDHSTETVRGTSKSARTRQPKSERTIYVDDETARKLVLAPKGVAFRIAEHADGTFSQMIENAKGNWETVKGSSRLRVENVAQNGLSPLELWGGEKVGSSTSYGRRHIGNPITQIESTPTGLTIQPKGMGFVIVKTIPWTETNSVTRDFLLSLKGTETPKDLLNAFGGFVGSLRTPEDTLAFQNILARKIATFGPNNFVDLIREDGKAIKDLRGWGVPGTSKWRTFQDWKRVMNAARQIPDEVTGEKGMPQFRNIGELSDLYQNSVQRRPSPAEIEAAFAYKRRVEFLKGFQQISALTRYQRLGAMEWTVKALDPSSARTTKAGETFDYSGAKLMGMRRNELPSSDALLIMGQHVGEETPKDLSNMGFRNSKLGKQIAENIKEGRGFLIELADPDTFPLSKYPSVGERWVRYVYTEKADSKLLNVTDMRTPQISNLDYDHYVVQPIMHFDSLTNTWRHFGDKTIAAFNIPAQAKDVAFKLNEIRKLIQEDKLVEAQAYRDAARLPQQWSEIYNWFRTDVTTEGLPIRGPLNKQWDITHVPAGKLSIDMGKDYERIAEAAGKKFEDINREKYGRFYDNPGAPGWDPFDVFTLRNEGTKASPIYGNADLQHIDPLTTINRGMSRAINNMFLEDYKTASIEHWIQEAKDHLTVSDANLASSPAYWFYNAVNDGIWKDGVQAEIKNNLMTANMQIKQFLGVTDAATNWFHRAAGLLADSIYGNKYLPTSIANMPASVLNWNVVRDPAQVIRSLTYHAKVGMFNPAQLFVQSNTYSSIWGIAGPKYAAPGTKAAMFHLWSRVSKDPEFLDHMDQLISNVPSIPGSSRWLRGQWKEAHDLFINSGMDKVGGEHIFQDNTFMYDFIGSKGASFLDMSKFFFTEAERNVRAGAFYTAYREFRDGLGHTGRLTAAQQMEVIQRADLLAGNMTRASASSINKGIFSPMFQFSSYYLRTAEMMVGKRLNSNEKMRLYGTYATMYGVPGAFGLSGLPIGDYITQKAQEMGYVRDSQQNSYLESFLAEGLPALILHQITGNWYNINQRYGLQGMQQIREFLSSDKTFLDIVGGAGFSTISNTIANFNGFYRAMLDGIKGEGHFPFKMEDALAPLQEISTASAGMKLYAAIATGKLISKKEGYLASGISPVNAIFQALTGLSPTETQDIVLHGWTRNEEKDMHKKALDGFVKEMHRAFQAQDDKDYQQSKEYQSRAWHWLRTYGYPEEKYSDAIAIATQDWQTIINRSNYDYYLKDVNEARKPDAQSGFMKWLKSRKN